MTTHEFDKTIFGTGDKAIYNKGKYFIASVDFEERLIGLVKNVEDYRNGKEIQSIVRAENCKHIPKKKGF